MYVFDGDWVFATAALVGVTYYYYKKFKKRVKTRVFNEDKKALLIGCDYEGTSNELRGCSKDISEMDIFLSEKGFNTTLLCDDDDRNLLNIKAEPIASKIKRHGTKS